MSRLWKRCEQPCSSVSILRLSSISEVVAQQQNSSDKCHERKNVDPFQVLASALPNCFDDQANSAETNTAVPIREAMESFLLKHIWNPSIWDFSSAGPGSCEISLDDGKVLSDEEVLDRAIEAKRRGQYNKSTYYYHLFDGYYKAFGKLFPGPVRGYIKTEICGNYFSHAYSLLDVMYKNMEYAIVRGLEAYRVNSYRVVRQDYILLQNIAKAVIDNNDFSSVLPFCANYSGSPLYRLPRSKTEIYEEFAIVREQIRNFFYHSI